MPRLVGKKSNTSLYAGLFCLVGVVAAGALGLEYTGVIDEVPGFGQPQRLVGLSHQPTQVEHLDLVA
jgi:hypothetical protein